MLYLILSTLYSIAFSIPNLPIQCTSQCDPSAADACANHGANYECVSSDALPDCYLCLPSFEGLTPDPTLFMVSSSCPNSECSVDLQCYSFTSVAQNRMTCIVDDATGCGECVELCTGVGQCSYIGSDYGCEAGKYCSASPTGDVCGVCMDSPVATSCGECTTYRDCNDLSGGIASIGDVTAICTYDDMGCGTCEDVSDLIGTTEFNDCQPNDQFACPDIWTPVCCSDGETYSNHCYARIAGQCYCDDGECPDGAETSTTAADDCQPNDQIVCTTLYDPVCCSNGMTYSNDCYARMYGQCDCEDGECPDETSTTEDCEPDDSMICTMDYVPVCCDGMTYGNACAARAAGKCDCEDGMCMTEEPDMGSTEMDCLPDPDMACYEIYDPVCCSDGETYPNDCYAERAGQCDCDDGECMETSSTTEEPASRPGDDANEYKLIVTMSFVIVMFSWM